MSYRPVPLSIHLTDPMPPGRRRFELRLDDHVIWRDSVWGSSPNQMEEAIAKVAHRLQDLMYNAALIQYDSDY